MDSDAIRWFVLNHIPGPGSSRISAVRRAVDTFNNRHLACIELFAPTIVSASRIGDRMVCSEKPLTYHYVFVRGTYSEIKSLCQGSNGFSFVIDHGGGSRYATVSDRSMADFMTIARACRNTLPFFPLDSVDLESGDLVEVVDGPFAGLVGYFIPRNKSVRGNIMIQVSQNLGTVAYDIHAGYVRVLEFSKSSRRGYDQIDAFVPKLYGILRHHSDGAPLTTREIAVLTVFHRRMSSARLGDRKVEAKLTAILYAVSRLLGDRAGEEDFYKRYMKLADSITSPVTKSFISLVFSIVDGDREEYARGVASLPPCEPKESCALALLREEYDYHNIKNNIG